MATGEADVAGTSGRERGSTSSDGLRRSSGVPIPGVPAHVVVRVVKTTPAEAAKFIGAFASVCGKLAQVTPAANNRPWHLNFGRAYPNQTFHAFVEAR